MPEYSKVTDSGSRQEFDTGSRRDNPKGKGRYDLVSPLAMRRLAVHLENGAVKYGDRNWELGQPMSRYVDSALRHLYKHLEGHRDEDHLAAAMWNVQGAIHTEEAIERGLLPAELADLPDYTVEEPPHPASAHGEQRAAHRCGTNGDCYLSGCTLPRTTVWDKGGLP